MELNKLYDLNLLVPHTRSYITFPQSLLPQDVRGSVVARQTDVPTLQGQRVPQHFHQRRHWYWWWWTWIRSTFGSSHSQCCCLPILVCCGGSITSEAEPTLCDYSFQSIRLIHFSSFLFKRLFKNHLIQFLMPCLRWERKGERVEKAKQMTTSTRHLALFYTFTLFIVLVQTEDELSVDNNIQQLTITNETINNSKGTKTAKDTHVVSLFYSNFVLHKKKT